MLDKFIAVYEKFFCAFVRREDAQALPKHVHKIVANYFRIGIETEIVDVNDIDQDRQHFSVRKLVVCRLTQDGSASVCPPFPTR